MIFSSGPLGILTICIGGIANGSFAVPSKRVTEWKWEHVWLVYCTLALAVLPLALALLFARNVFTVVFPRHLSLVMQVVAIGALWGVGALLFGYSLNRLGIAIANAIVNGLVVLLGSLGPLLIGAVSLSPHEIKWLAAGLLLLTLGVGICAWASVLRDLLAASGEGSSTALRASTAGVLLAVLAGALSSLLNIGFVHGAPLMKQASFAGVTATAASLAIWVPVLLGGYFVNALCTARQIHRGNSWTTFLGHGGAAWARSSAMGALWFGGIVFYGIGATLLGAAGTVYGWAIITGTSITTSTVWGIATGEWEKAAGPARAWMFAGVAFLLLSFVILCNTRASG